MAQRVEDPSMTESREQCRRQLRRRLEDGIQYGFCRVDKPIPENG